MGALTKDQLFNLQLIFKTDPKETIKVFFYNYSLQQSRIINYRKRYIISNRKRKEEEEKEEVEKVSDYNNVLNVISELGTMGTFDIYNLGLDDAVIIIDMIRYKELEMSILKIIEDGDDESEVFFKKFKYDVESLVHLRHTIQKKNLENIKNG